MAKELGFQPKSLIKNIPSPSQRWKEPVNEWVRSLYEQKIGSKRPAPTARPSSTRVVEFRNPDNPWPDHPAIPDLQPVNFDNDLGGDFEEVYSRFEPPSSEDVDEENGLLLRRQRLFRWAAQSVAVAVSELPAVRKVAAFGAVARPLKMEVPRFSQFRRHRIEVLHECTDLDLAIWMNDFADLKSVKKRSTGDSDSYRTRRMAALRTTRWTCTCSTPHRAITGGACAILPSAQSPASASAGCPAAVRIRFFGSLRTIGSIRASSPVNQESCSLIATVDSWSARRASKGKFAK